jgi:hypothetical protein
VIISFPSLFATYIYECLLFNGIVISTPDRILGPLRRAGIINNGTEPELKRIFQPPVNLEMTPVTPVTLVCPFAPCDYQMPEVRKALAEK